MKALQTSVCLVVALLVARDTAAELLKIEQVTGPKHKRSLHATQAAVVSPDVSLTGACSADIVQHCKHLIGQEWLKFAKGYGKSLHLTHGQAAQSVGITDAKDTTVTSAGQQASAAGPSAAGSATSATQATAGGSVGTAASSVKAAAQAVQNAAAGAAAAAGRAATAADTGEAAAGGAKAAGAKSADAGAAMSSSAAAAGFKSGASVAGGAAAEVAAEAAISGVGKATGATAVEGSAAGGASSNAGAGSGAASTAGGADSAQAVQQGVAAQGGSEAAAGAGAAGTAAGVNAAGTTAAGTVGAGTAGAAASAATGSQQQQQQDKQQRRRLLADTAAGTTVAAVGAQAVSAGMAKIAAAGLAKVVLAEVKAVEAHQDDLAKALGQLGLGSGGMSATVMAAAAAPIARCLQGVMHASEMSISPNIPDVADECKAEVRAVMIRRAGDVRFDPPLLAACAHDIVTHCEDIGSDTGAVMGCLKAVKSQLLPLCRTAMTVRQAAAAEDLSLDPDLHRSCGAERDKLCAEAGWGNGAAQSCLLGHLRGSLPQVFSELLFPDSDSSASFSAAAAGVDPGAAANGSSSTGVVELSEGCSAALVQRLIEEGEDIRFNYRLSSACAGDKQVLCRDVKPGGAAVLGCLEDHLDSPNMQEECRSALNDARQLRSLDVRLDHTFTTSCATDVRNLCGEEVAGVLGAAPKEVSFGQAGPFECLRGRLDQVRDATCRRHLYESVIAAYHDNRLDAGLMRGCHQEIAVLCAQHPARALECLQDKIDKFSRDDSPAVLKGKFSDSCLGVVLERRQQAATDLAFLPDLMAACAPEHATFCAAEGLEGVRALDCLADHRTSPDFSDRCGTALRDYLAEAARDIRTMAGLQTDCEPEIASLCKGVLPGEGRVVSCLRDNRANITGELCRRQVMRLLGFMVEDHRLDAKLVQACTGDVQKYCAGVEVGDGQVHDCLRRSFDHLSPECRAAEEEMERLEHEDVRLNPRLMRECPLAIRSFCGDVPPGDALVIRCLQSNMDKGHFPPACRQALLQLTDRAAVKYSLNPRLEQECEEDTQRLCPEAVDELGASRHAVTGTGGRHSEETTLGCLARQSGDLAPACRAELQALVKLSLNRYRVGMPLTSQCDGDVMQRCQVDQMAAPFLQSGYVLSCLAKHAAKLHRPCWELVSTMDEGQFKRAAVAESSHWQTASGAVVDEKVLKQVAADVRRELEPRIYNSVHEQIHRKTAAMARNVTGALVLSIAPKVNALMHTTLSLLALTGVGLLGALLAWRKFMAKGGSVLVVRKDGRV